MTKLATAPQLILALDYERQEDAFTLVEQLDPKDCRLKVGFEMFLRFGEKFVKSLIQRNFAVFLDLKFHDIPQTVARACQAAAELGVWMINVHATGGPRMLAAAVKALETFGKEAPLLVAVTLLTSMDAKEFTALSLLKCDESSVEKKLGATVLHLAKLAKEAGLKGVVCSAWEVPAVKLLCGQDFLTVTPGVRPELPVEKSSLAKDDQRRVVTPAEALRLGSDYLVVGRPITRAPDPLLALQRILQSFG